MKHLMTRLWPDGSPIQVMADENARPLRFVWRGRTHEVETITREWRVRTEWWRGGEAWRAYFRLTTTSGMLVVIYHDLSTGGWLLQRLFD